MSLFKRSVVSEILSHAGVVISTLLVVWLSVLLVRLLGEAAAGSIGADVVVGLATFSSITALPVILSVSLFIAVLTTITRNFRESEMVVWFASGLSLRDWVGPVLRVAVPFAVIISVLTLMASPWAQQGLKDFKRKWGDSEGIVATRDIAVDLRGAAIRAISRWRGRKDRAAALAWLEGR